MHQGSLVFSPRLCVPLRVSVSLSMSPRHDDKPEKTAQQVVRTEDYTNPRIEQDANVQPEDIQPEMNELVGAMIGIEKKEGSEYGNESPANTESVSGVIETPKPAENNN